MTPEQCRSGRAWLAWSQDDLAKAAKVGLSTVKDFENGKRTPIASTLTAMKAAMEKEGIGFSFDGGGTASGITFGKVASSVDG